jgi:hypothetical protein
MKTNNHKNKKHKPNNAKEEHKPNNMPKKKKHGHYTKKHKPSKNVNKEYGYNKHKERTYNPTIAIIKTMDLTMQRKNMNIT